MALRISTALGSRCFWGLAAIKDGVRGGVLDKVSALTCGIKKLLLLKGITIKHRGVINSLNGNLEKVLGIKIHKLLKARS